VNVKFYFHGPALDTGPHIEKIGDAVIQPQKSATLQEMWCLMKFLLGGHLKKLSYLILKDKRRFQKKS
jgi:hypothetical protein